MTIDESENDVYLSLIIGGLYLFVVFSNFVVRFSVG